MEKRIGIGSISLALVILAFFWSFEIYGFCLGDEILTILNIQTWSDNINTTGIHYTVFYSLPFLILGLILSIKFKNDIFAKVGKWLSIIFIGILLLSFIFMIK